MMIRVVTIVVIVEIFSVATCPTTCTCNGWIECTGTSFSSIVNELSNNIGNLNLRLKNVIHIGGGLFRRFRSLTLLAIDAEKLSSLNGSAFFGLKLRSLRLFNTRLTSISGNLFNGMDDTLLNLQMSNNCLLSFVTETLLNGLTHLKTLNLSFNKLPVINRIFFKSLTLLKKLYMNDNELDYLHPDTFKTLRNLDYLMLSANKLTKISPFLFNPLVLLTTLIIEDNKLLEIENGAFSALANLKSLSLNRNCIHTLYQNTLEGLDSLNTLSLEQNKLTYLPYKIFSNQKKLKRLYLGRNQLTLKSKYVFGGLEKIEYISLIANQLTHLKSDTFACLLTLKSLDLANNRIAYVHNETFARLGRLMRLKLRNNSINQLHKKTFFHLEKLTTLDLSLNPLCYLPSLAFLKLKKLTTLYLNGCRLKTLNDDMFLNLTSLRQLSLSSNNLVHLQSDLFSSTKNLQLLRLDGNELNVLPRNIFSSLDKLRILFLSNNKLTSLRKDLIHHSSNIYTLNISCNKLTFIDENYFSPLKYLRFVDISENNLTYLPQDLLKNQHLLITVNVRRNRIYCSLFLDELVTKIHATEVLADCILDEAKKNIPMSSFKNYMRNLKYLQIDDGNALVNELKYVIKFEQNFTFLRFDMKVYNLTEDCRNIFHLDVKGKSYQKVPFFQVDYENRMLKICLLNSNSFCSNVSVKINVWNIVEIIIVKHIQSIFLNVTVNGYRLRHFIAPKGWMAHQRPILQAFYSTQHCQRVYMKQIDVYTNNSTPLQYTKKGIQAVWESTVFLILVLLAAACFFCFESCRKKNMKLCSMSPVMRSSIIGRAILEHSSSNVVQSVLNVGITLSHFHVDYDHVLKIQCSE